MIHTACAVVGDLLRLLALMFQSRTRLAAENLFLRNQLACYLERNVRPHRTDNASRIMLVMLSRWWSGGQCSRLCVPTGSSGGNERPFDCSGAGNHADGVARQYPPNASSSSPTWRRRIALRTSRLGVLHWNVTVHPTDEWTIQQFRDGLLSRARARSRWDLRARRRRGGAFDVAARAEDAGRIAGRTVPPGDADWPPVSPAHRVVAMSGSVGYVTITGLKASLREFLRSTGTSVVARRVVLDARFSEGAIRLPTGRL